MTDIRNRNDLYFLLSNFYNKLLLDEKINFIFTEIAQINLEEHLEVITDFWEQTLFFKTGYRNNVLQIHQNLHHKFPLQKIHFDIWLKYFNSTVDENFEGDNAEIIKTKALSIATVMQIKMNL